MGSSATFSLCAGALAFACATGCFAEGPTYEAPDQVPPFIPTDLVSPPIGVIHPLTRPFQDKDISFTVPYRSVDVGVDLRALLYVDKSPGTELNVEGNLPIKAGDPSFDLDPPEQELPKVTMPWRPLASLTDGCHTVTITLAHENNWPRAGLEPIDESRAASVVWFFDVREEDAEAASLDSCPAIAEVVQ